jgi:nucleoside-diphosphate-sugar epimerase
VEGVDLVFHLSAQAGVRSSWGADFRVYSDNNILGTQMMLEACRRADVDRFVYASSSSVYGDIDELPMSEDAQCRPYSPYGVSKLAAEQLCHLYWRNMGVATVSLRLFTVYGARQRPDMGFHKFMRAVMADEPIRVYGDGLQTRDFTHVSDIVNGMVAASAAPPGSVMNLAGGSQVTLLEALECLGEVAGRPIRLNMRDRQAGDVTHTWATIAAAEELIGYSPHTSLVEGLRGEWEWLQELSTRPGFPWGVKAV